MKFTIPMAGEWATVDERELAGDKHGRFSPGERASVMARIALYQENRLACFLPHGVAWHGEEKRYAGGRIKLPPSTYPRAWKNDGVAFINDVKSQYVFMRAPRKTGKSYAGAAKMGYYICECDPDWPAFTENGIVCPKWNGPTQVVVASFGIPNIKDLWAVYQEVLPRYELGVYAKGWGRRPGEKGLARSMTFGDGRPKQLELAQSHSIITFLCYTQAQHVWESFKAQHLHADEQIRITLLRAWEDGSSTFGDFTQALFTLSGFVLDERPEDTGMAGPLYQICQGRRRGGKTVGSYNMDIESTPDVILSPQKKKERFDRYVNPAIERSEKDARRALAVYYPGWEPGGGLLFGPDVWDREVHLIKPLWADDKTPKDWTKWRVIDYSDKKTTCCSWWAVGPDFIVLYRLLYEDDMLVAQSARKIIEMSHNVQRPSGVERDLAVGATYDRWDEDQRGEQFYSTLIDPRAAKWRKDSQTVVQLYRRYGIQNVLEASTEWNETQIPNLKDLLRIDREKPHPFNKREDGTPVMGAARLYFFDLPCIMDAVEEIERMPEDPSVEGHRVMDVRYAHDFIDTAKYFASDDPRYFGATGINDREDRNEEVRATPYTGY